MSGLCAHQASEVCDRKMRQEVAFVFFLLNSTSALCAPSIRSLRSQDAAGGCLCVLSVKQYKRVVRTKHQSSAVHEVGAQDADARSHLRQCLLRGAV
jgi:hypothetical protein